MLEILLAVLIVVVIERAFYFIKIYKKKISIYKEPYVRMKVKEGKFIWVPLKDISYYIMMYQFKVDNPKFKVDYSKLKGAELNSDVLKEKENEW